MPELPEVETVKRGLQKLIIGRKIIAVNNDNPKSFPNAINDVEQFLINSKVIDVRRRAKVLLIDLSTDYTLVIHLKMTGQLVFVGQLDLRKTSHLSDNTSPSSEDIFSDRDDPVGSSTTEKWLMDGDSVPEGAGILRKSSEERFAAGHPNDSLVGNLPDKSTRVTLDFDDKSHLYFNDQRKFGWVRLMPTAEVPNIDFMKKVGPEPLEADFTVDEFISRFDKRPRTNIKAAILDQSVIAGVGNIYADESLWGAKIHPKRLVGSLAKSEFKKLYTEIRAVMNLSIEKGGSTNRNYVNAEGKKGSYMDFARVFRREGQACLRCGTEIIKIRVAGRGTHICPFCQRVGN